MSRLMSRLTLLVEDGVGPAHGIGRSINISISISILVWLLESQVEDRVEPAHGTLYRYKYTLSIGIRIRMSISILACGRCTPGMEWLYKTELKLKTVAVVSLARGSCLGTYLLTVYLQSLTYLLSSRALLESQSG